MVRGIVVLILLAGTLDVVSGQGLSPSFDTAMDRFEVHDVGALEGILRLGKESRLPVGVIRSPGDGLCSTKVTLDVSGQSPREIAQTLVQNSPSYAIEVRDNVLLAEPKNVSPGTQKLLGTVIPVFNEGPETAEDLHIDVWRFTLAVIHPEKGTLVNSLRNPNVPLFPRIEVKNATVMQILNHVVSQAQGGGWILLPVSEDYQTAADKPFVEIINYADEATFGRFHCEEVSAQP